MLTIDRYAALLARLNVKSGKAIKNIILLPGMDFLDRGKWWVGGEWRCRPHEGVDVVCWADDAGEKHFLGEGIKVPCLLAGEILAICDDFLGQSVFVRGDGGSLGDIVAVHAHILTKVRLGDRVVAGEEIGMIAPGNGPVPAHLHLSLLRFSPALPWAGIGWKHLNACDRSLFLNPFA
ncbi:MAG: M23 family metallopeptidase [Desulfobulbaceae bacterium]|nr:M23 family metallopeptidase [Desulfobulbaceae bacterium]